jgi:AraC-like DNA-binding protein
VTQSYVERAPRAELAGVVRTVWMQRTGALAYVQRHVPTGGVELHVPIGGGPRVLGPLTGPSVEVIPPHTTLVGVRFHPGTAPPLPAVPGDLVDQRVAIGDLWGSSAADRLGEAMADAPGPEAALHLLQDHLLAAFRTTGGVDPLVREAVRLLMPWQPVDVAAVADRLSISTSQLRRRCLRAVGVGPKVLQRTLRFQGFLALAQARAGNAGAGGSGLAGLAAEAGYADQAHLSRECLGLSGLSPRELLVGGEDRCGCGHDHAASYTPFLAERGALLHR